MNLMKKEISNSLVSKAARDEFNHYKRLLRLSDQLSMSGGGGGFVRQMSNNFFSWPVLKDIMVQLRISCNFHNKTVPLRHHLYKKPATIFFHKGLSLTCKPFHNSNEYIKK